MRIRILVLIVGLPVLAWVFVSVLFREARTAVWSAWNETMINLDQMRATFRSKSVNKEDWS